MKITKMEQIQTFLEHYLNNKKIITSPQNRLLILPVNMTVFKIPAGRCFDLYQINTISCNFLFDSSVNGCLTYQANLRTEAKIPKFGCTFFLVDLSLTLSVVC